MSAAGRSALERYNEMGPGVTPHLTEAEAAQGMNLRSRTQKLIYFVWIS